MTSENVALDGPEDDEGLTLRDRILDLWDAVLDAWDRLAAWWRSTREDEVGAGTPVRPIGAQLARVGERAVDLPADVLLGLAREVSWVHLGALALILRWRLWQTDAARRAKLEDDRAVAKTTGGRPPSALDERSAQRQERRAKLTAAVVIVAAGALVGASIVSVTWGFVQWIGVAGACGLLWAAHEYKLRVLAALAPLPVAVVLLLGVDAWRWWPVAVAVAVVALACEQVGRRWQPAQEQTAAKARPGVGYKVLWETVRLRLLEEKVTAERTGTRPLVVEGREVGVAFGITARERIRRDAVHAVARELEAGVGRVRWMPDPTNEAAGELLIRWADPLARFIACPYDPPASRTVLEPLEVAVDEDGNAVALPFAHQNFLITGMTRAGKSALTAVIVDKLSACVDVEIDYIDTVGAPDLAAAARCFRKMAVNRKGDAPTAAVVKATSILAEAAALARERSQDITEELLCARPGDAPGQNHTPTEAHPQRFVIVEEFPTFRVQAGQEAIAHVEEVERRGLKAAVGMIILSQSATSGNGVGSTVIQAQSTVKIALAMPGAEIQYALGEGRKDAGYRADLLQPATLDDPRDAGKFYAVAPNIDGPCLMRSFGLRAPEQIRRSWERHPEVAETVEGAADVLDAVIVPEPLATLERLCEAGDVHTGTLLAELPDGWTSTSVAAALRPHKVRSTNVTCGGRQAKGFRAEQVKRAVQELGAAG